MEVVDVVQKCTNLMEAIYYVHQDTRAYRTHSHDITRIVCNLWPTIVGAQQHNPNLTGAPGAEEIFEALKTELEAALMELNKCCAMTQFDKLLDQGQTKRTLTMIRENLFMRAKEAYTFTMRVCPPRAWRKSASSSPSGRSQPSNSVAAEGSTSLIRFADVQLANNFPDKNKNKNPEES